MKIGITIPSFAVHGGIRVILEHANRLAKLHTVYLFPLTRVTTCNWFTIDPRVRIASNDSYLQKCDVLIITSPHSIHWQHKPRPRKKIIFQQMMEHLFRPASAEWNAQCTEFYTSSYPLITLSQWNKEDMQRIYGRTGDVHIIGNGVNTSHFPISTKPKDGKTVLVEGWEASNPSKDVDHIGARVAMRLKKDGYKIITYSAMQLKSFAAVPHEYHLNPKLRTMNDLYERATILIKASRYDDRACAPMEAMTKGTVTARAIIKGDDDLVHNVNCLRCDYDEINLYKNARRLLLDSTLRKRLAANGYKHLEQNSWDHWIDAVDSILKKLL